MVELTGSGLGDKKSQQNSSNDIFEWSFARWRSEIADLLKYSKRKWPILFIATCLGAAVNLLYYYLTPPTYTAKISFVLSTESSKNNSISGLAAQLGISESSSGTDNIFAGDNIIVLFGSQKIIRQTLLIPTDPVTKTSLINYVCPRMFSKYNELLPFPAYERNFTRAQDRAFKAIAIALAKRFIVEKTDKKTVFYSISVTTSNGDVSYHLAKSLLDQTSKFFINTKTSAAIKGLKLVKNEADSLATAIRINFNSTASIVDRTYNINPSMSVLRSTGAFNQAKSAALAAAYTEVMRNLELAKINVQKETPLFAIIDEPDLPLNPDQTRILRNTVALGLLFLFASFIIISVRKKKQDAKQLTI